jgi:hypothetical protein
MGMLPKPAYTDGVSASRNATSSAGSGRSSGRIYGPVCTTSRSGGCHGPRTGDSALAKRRHAAHAGTASPRGSPAGRRMQPRNETFSTLFSKADLKSSGHESWAGCQS